MIGSGRSCVGPTLVVLAAGMGARYGGLKQVEPVGPDGETILDYSVYDALRSGFGKLVFVIRREMEASFRATVVARFEGRVAEACVFQDLDRVPEGFVVPKGRTKPWGTAHAVLMAADAVHEPFAVINADDFYGREGFGLLRDFLCGERAAGAFAMAGFLLRNTLSEFGAVARGICEVTDDGVLKHVVERTHIERAQSEAADVDAGGQVTVLSGDEIVSMNMWGFGPEVFQPLRDYVRRFFELEGGKLDSECYLPGAVDAFLRKGGATVRVLPTKSRWLGVTYREDREHVKDEIGRLVREGAYPERLWA